MLIQDVPDQFLQRILERHQPRRCIAVSYDRNLRLVFSQEVQEIVTAHLAVHRRDVTYYFKNRRVFPPERKHFQYVTTENVSSHIIEGLSYDWIA